MYLHCRHGFVEADAWDGATIPVPAHQVVADALAEVAPHTVIVVRARRRDTLEALINALPRAHHGGILPKIEVFESPAGWDYEWRVYLTAIEWGACMTRVAMDLDYRNFKHTAQDAHGISRREYPLALAIWNAAHREVPRDKPPLPIERQVMQRPVPMRITERQRAGLDPVDAADEETTKDETGAGGSRQDRFSWGPLR